MAEEIKNPEMVAEVVPANVEQQETKEEKKPEVKMVSFPRTGWQYPETFKPMVELLKKFDKEVEDALLAKIKEGCPFEKDGIVYKKSLDDAITYCWKQEEEATKKYFKDIGQPCPHAAPGVWSFDDVYSCFVHFWDEDSILGSSKFNKDGTPYVEPKSEPKTTEKKTKPKSKVATSGSSTPVVSTTAKPTFSPCKTMGEVLTVIFRWKDLSVEEKKYRVLEDSYFIFTCSKEYEDNFKAFRKEVDDMVDNKQEPVDNKVDEPVKVEEPIEQCPLIEDDSLPFDVDDVVETDDEIEIIDDDDLEIIDDEIEEEVEQPVEEPKVEKPVKKAIEKQEPKKETNWAEDETPIVPQQVCLWDLD